MPSYVIGNNNNPLVVIGNNNNPLVFDTFDAAIRKYPDAYADFVLSNQWLDKTKRTPNNDMWFCFHFYLIIYNIDRWMFISFGKAL